MFSLFQIWNSFAINLFNYFFDDGTEFIKAGKIGITGIEKVFSHIVGIKGKGRITKRR